MGYHHGTARVALLTAATELLEREGAAGLSLRQVAEQAGLSRQAPYNHFENKQALLSEIAGAGFRTLAERMDAIGVGLPPLDRLAAAAKCYIALGTAQPALFRLMFGKELVDLCRYPSAQRDADTALHRLSAIIAELDPVADIGDLTLVAWSLVHGYTGLCIETGLEGAEAQDRRAMLFAQAIQALGARRMA